MEFFHTSAYRDHASFSVPALTSSRLKGITNF